MKTVGATKQFLAAKVGDGCKNSIDDVRRLQRLLIGAGENVGTDDGRWGIKTAAALANFQKKYAKDGVKVQPFVGPGDHCLLIMAWKAGILIPLPGKAGTAGVVAMHNRLVNAGIKYNKGADKGGGNRAVFGVDGRTDYAVQTTNGRLERGPIEMDCTTYVNLMLSIYANGHAHGAPYDASCQDFGGTSSAHCARDRFRYPLVKREVSGSKTTLTYFTTAEQIAAATKGNPDSLYVIEVALPGTGFVTHMSLLSGPDVYECTTNQAGSACIKRNLETFMANKEGKKIIYLFGPSPNVR